MHIDIVVQAGRKPKESLPKELHQIKHYKMQQQKEQKLVFLA